MEINIKLTIDDRLVSTGRWLRRHVPARRAALLLAIGTMSAAVVTAAPLPRLHEFESGDPIRAAEINENFDDLYDAVNGLFIRTDTTIEVEDCDQLIAELGDLSEKRIRAGVTVTFELPEGVLACPTINVDHVDGHHIHIVGQGSAETKLTFASDGFIIAPTRGIGLIDKLTLEGSTFEGRGLVAWGSSYARLGSDTIVRKFDVGVYADGSYVDARGVISEDHMETGFQAGLNGFMNVSEATARRSPIGFASTDSSAMLADDAVADDCAEFGFNANGGGVIRGTRAAAIDCEHGYDANANSTIVVKQSTVSMSTEYGYAAWNDSYIDATNVVTDDNTLEGFSARHGSYMRVLNGTGNDVTYAPPGLNVANTSERSLIFEGE